MEDNDRALASATADELTQLRVENEALRGRLRRRARTRRWVTWVLVLLSVLLVVTSTVAVWAARTAFNNDRFMAAVGPTLDDPVFYSAVGDVVSEHTLEALDLQTRVTNRLDQLDEYISVALLDAVEIEPQAQELLARFDRPTLGSLAPPLTTALEDRVTQIVDRLVTSEQFTSRFPDLVGQAHRAAVALVRGDSAEFPNVHVADGEVRLNLTPIIRDALDQIIEENREFLPDVELPETVSTAVDQGRQQLGDALQTQLPPDFGQVTLLSGDALSEIQQAANVLERLVWLLVVLTVVVIAITIAVAPSRRRSVVTLGLGVVLGLVVGAALVRRVEADILERAGTPNGERVAQILLDAMTSTLRTAALIVGAVAVVAALVAYLAGRPSWVGRVSERGSRILASTPRGRELDRWVAAHYDLLRIAGVAVAGVVVFIAGIDLIPVIVVGGLLGLYLWAVYEFGRRAVPDEPASGPEPEERASSGSPGPPTHPGR